MFWGLSSCPVNNDMNDTDPSGIDRAVISLLCNPDNRGDNRRVTTVRHSETRRAWYCVVAIGTRLLHARRTRSSWPWPTLWFWRQKGPKLHVFCTFWRNTLTDIYINFQWHILGTSPNTLRYYQSMKAKSKNVHSLKSQETKRQRDPIFLYYLDLDTISRIMSSQVSSFSICVYFIYRSLYRT